MGWQERLNNNSKRNYGFTPPVNGVPNIISSFDGAECFAKFFNEMRERKYKCLILPPVRKEHIDAKGLYFLVSCKTIVYVGQSISGIHKRVSYGHKEKDYELVFYLKFPEITKEHLNEMEKYFIRTLKPKYNKILYDSAKASKCKLA